MCQQCNKKKIKARVTLDSGEVLLLCKDCTQARGSAAASPPTSTPGIEKQSFVVVVASPPIDSVATLPLLPSGDAALKYKQEQIERYMAQERESLVVMRVEQSQAEQVCLVSPARLGTFVLIAHSRTCPT